MRRSSMKYLLSVVALCTAAFAARQSLRTEPATPGAAQSQHLETPSASVAVVQRPTPSPAESSESAAVRAEQPGAPESTADLLVGLDDPDPFQQLRAAEALAKVGRLDALPKLQKMDLRANGYLASTVVRSIAHLATMASPEARDGAATYLGTFFAAEVKRQGQDGAALGNAIVTIDALADTGSSEAVAPLITELDKGSLPLAARTKIVEALSALDARPALPAIERFHLHVSTLPRSEDPFEEELRREALGAAKDATSRLSSSR